MSSRRAVLLSGLAPLLRGESGVRPAAVAGEFYPSDRNKLAAEVDRRLAAATVRLPGPLQALIVPHAGYPYSGQVAAEAYALLKGLPVRRVVIIAPSHVESFPFNSVFNGTHYQTPLGDVPVDAEFCRRIVSKRGPIRLSAQGHQRTGARGEHSLEVQLPFLQRVLPQPFTLVPIVMGQQSYPLCRALAVELARYAATPGTLILASSDLSHYHPYADATLLDRRVLRAIQEWDYLALSANFDADVWEACGGGPIIATMMAAERLGAARAELLKYANSGDVTSERTKVVGYASFAIRTGTPADTAALALTTADQQELLSIARRAMEHAARTRKMLVLTPPASSSLLADRGVFVTLKSKGQLRGCVGNTSASRPLFAAIRDAAAYATTRDPRFKPVAEAELPDIQIELSVLSRLRRTSDAAQVKVGTHGLVLRRADHEGILLPQVAVEERMTREQFLTAVAEKAGLPADAWRHPDSDLFTFTAQVFS